MRQKAFARMTVCLVLVLGSLPIGLGQAATRSATLRAVTVASSPAGNDVLLRLEGGYTFRTTRAASDSVWIDVIGAAESVVPSRGRCSNDIVAGYRLLRYTDAGGTPVLRLQLEMKQDRPFMVQQEPQGLRLTFSEGTAAGGEVTARSAPVESSSGPIPQQVEPTPAAAVSSSGVRWPVKVSALAVKPGPAGETYIEIYTSHAAAYRSFRLNNPARLVVDLDGARCARAVNTYPGMAPLLKRVRMAQFSQKGDGVVRVVAELEGDPSADVSTQASGVRIELKSSHLTSVPVPASVPAPARLVAAQDAVPPAASTTSGASAPALPPTPQRAEPEPEIVTSRANPTPAEPQVAAIPDIQSALPAAGSDKSVAAAPRPEPPRSTPRARQAVQAAQTMAVNVPTALAAPTPATSGLGEDEKPKYTGEPISLNLKDVDLKDFFRLIHEISGLNIIVDPNVAGTVTMVLDAVPWDQAVDIVLKNSGLGRTMEGNVLRIAKMATLTAEAEQAKKLDIARMEALPLVTVFRPVNYAKASTVSALLKTWSSGGALTKRGSVMVDERTNTLIISDIQPQIPVIDSIIGRLDRKAKQVYIEARIVRADADFTRDLAGALTVGTVNKSGSLITGGGTGTEATVTTSTEERSITVSQASASGFGVYAVSNAGARYIINAALSAAETKSQAKTISAPTIVTQNNMPGTVKQGTEIPIQTTINNTISIQYVNALLELTVTPQVTEDGDIFLQITVRNAAAGANLTNVGPSINTQEATTQVMVPDGGTVVFGGINVTGRSRSATYVPVLGSIPILGHLFKSSNVSDSDQQLLFFVSPKVMPG